MVKILLLFFSLITVFGYSHETTLVIFGATGDLSAKKLLPAIYNLIEDREVKDIQIVGVGRRELDQAGFQRLVLDSLEKHSRQKPKSIPLNCFYLQTTFENKEGYKRLKEHLGRGNTLYYLSTEPQYFASIIQNLKESGLLEEHQGFWKRVIIEKPFGYDTTSAEVLYREISQHLNKSQMYLVDHYLGKEGVINLRSLRENPELEARWSAKYIDHVQISLSEKIGIGSRGHFWEGTGLLRDVVQNHMMQILALLAMEYGSSNAKTELLQAIAPLKSEDIVRGQYGEGIIDGQVSQSYLKENEVAQDSQIETFVAARLYINNARWSGVPFYLRAGKRLSKQATEIAITFKDKKQLYICLQPKSYASMDGKVLFQQKSQGKEAYENILLAAIKGDPSLFVDIEEILISWRLFTPILTSWQTATALYEAGSSGPKAALELIEKDGRSWHASFGHL